MTCLAFLPGPGGGLATAGNMDSAIRVFQEVSGAELQTMRGREQLRERADLPAGGEDHQREPRPHDSRMGRRGWARTRSLPLGSSVDALSLAPDNETLVSVELSVREDKIRSWPVPALLRVRGEVKAEDCEKWRGVWKSAQPSRASDAPVSQGPSNPAVSQK